MFRSVFGNNSVFNLHFMKVSMENDNNFGYEKITILVDNMPLSWTVVRDQLDRWNELREVLRVQTRAEVAKILFDR
jgi:hypothetical protein